jgi:polar amino acid transport system substrate-binding protein
MSGMTITPLRQMRIAFSNPYYHSGQMALVPKKYRRAFPQGYYAILGLSITLRFGVVKGTTGEAFVRKNFGSAKSIRAYRSARIATEKLRVGLLDIVIHDAPVILSLAAEYEGQGLTPIPSLLTEEYLAWGIRKQDVELLEAANDYLEELKASGKLASMVRRWIPFSKQ